MDTVDSIEEISSSELERPRILVVDDNADNLFTYDTTLSSLNYTIVKVSSGKEALRHLMTGDFALILLDVVMPEMNGFETAKLIRARKKTSAVPIMFVTAYRDDDIKMNDGYKIGAVDYIFTPIDPEILKSKVNAFVNLFNYNRTREMLLQRELLLARERREHEWKLAEAKHEAEVHRRESVQERQSAALIAAKAENLAQYNAELRQFAYVASHDLQEPLRVVTNYLQLLEAQYSDKLDENAREYIDVVLSSARRMKQLIYDLLSYSKVTYQDGVESSPVEAESILQEVVKTLSVTAQETGAEITSDPLPVVYGDALHFSQLLQNLLSNALKFRSGGPPRIHISAEERDGMCVFCVADNGIGIHPKYFEKVFTIFQRLHTREAFPGTGIGLAICKKIVERQGGKIWVESQEGKGSKFYFSFPLQPRVPSTPSEATIESQMGAC